MNKVFVSHTKTFIFLRTERFRYHVASVPNNLKLNKGGGQKKGFHSRPITWFQISGYEL